MYPLQLKQCVNMQLNNSSKVYIVSSSVAHLHSRMLLALPNSSDEHVRDIQKVSSSKQAVKEELFYKRYV
jgi:hypothetical protein